MRRDRESNSRRRRIDSGTPFAAGRSPKAGERLELGDVDGSNAAPRKGCGPTGTSAGRRHAISIASGPSSPSAAAPHHQPHRRARPSDFELAVHHAALAAPADRTRARGRARGSSLAAAARSARCRGPPGRDRPAPARRCAARAPQLAARRTCTICTTIDIEVLGCRNASLHSGSESSRSTTAKPHRLRLRARGVDVGHLEGHVMHARPAPFEEAVDEAAGRPGRLEHLELAGAEVPLAEREGRVRPPPAGRPPSSPTRNGRASAIRGTPIAM